MKKRFRITIEGKAYEVDVESIDNREGAARVESAPAISRPAPAGRAVGKPEPSSPSVSPSQVSPAIRPISKQPLPTGGGSGIVRAPMPCSILSIKCKAGDKVNRGEILLNIEAMKMEQDVYAPVSGVIKEVKVAAGSSVKHGDILVLIEPN